MKTYPQKEVAMNSVSRANMRAILGGILAFAVAGAGVSQAAQKGEVVISSYGGTFQDAQRKAFFEPFEKETGIKVVDTTAPLLPKIKAMVETRNVEWDVVEVEAATLLVLAKQGLLEPLDYANFDKETLRDIDARVVHPYGIGTIFFSNVIGYNTKKYSKDIHPRSWAEFWDVKKFPGPRALFAGDFVVTPIEMALMADGVAPDKLYPIDLERAYRSLSRIKPQVVKWLRSGGEGPQLLVDGQVDLASAANGRFEAVMEKGAPIGYEWNQGILRVDYWAIPKGAKNLKNAMNFIEFASKPKPQAELAKLIPYGPTNKRAFEHMSVERARRLPSHPENLSRQVLYNAEWWADVDKSGKSHLERNIEMWNAWITR